jgi:hypothetical protein
MSLCLRPTARPQMTGWGFESRLELRFMRAFHSVRPCEGKPGAHNPHNSNDRSYLL